MFKRFEFTAFGSNLKFFAHMVIFASRSVTVNRFLSTSLPLPGPYRCRHASLPQPRHCVNFSPLPYAILYELRGELRGELRCGLRCDAMPFDSRWLVWVPEHGFGEGVQLLVNGRATPFGKRNNALGDAVTGRYYQMVRKTSNSSPI